MNSCSVEDQKYGHVEVDNSRTSPYEYVSLSGLFSEAKALKVKNLKLPAPVCRKVLLFFHIMLIRLKINLFVCSPLCLPFIQLNLWVVRGIKERNVFRSGFTFLNSEETFKFTFTYASNEKKNNLKCAVKSTDLSEEDSINVQRKSSVGLKDFKRRQSNSSTFSIVSL